MFTVGVLSVSDKGSRGERVDESGALIKELIASAGGEVEQYAVVPDEEAAVAGMLRQWSDHDKLAAIITTGGTGLSPRDVTPEATLAVVERQAPGIAEAIRLEGLRRNPRAMLSRGVAGVRGGTLIVNLPGSAMAVREGLAVLLPVLPHAVEILTGQPTDHA